MAAENRLIADQLAALAPDDAVTIETIGDFRRPRRSSGTVVRIEGPYVVVSSRNPRGVPYVHHYGRRDGVRIGGGHCAELANAQMTGSGATKHHRQVLHIDGLYRM